MYILVYYVKNRGVFEKKFYKYPTDKQLHFLIDRNDIYSATLWKKSKEDTFLVRVIDLI